MPKIEETTTTTVHMELTAADILAAVAEMTGRDIPIGAIFKTIARGSQGDEVIATTGEQDDVEFTLTFEEEE